MNNASGIWLYAGLVLCPFLLHASTDQPALFIADPVTAIGAFTSGIEGPACDLNGNVYAVNFQHQGSIGKIYPNGTGEIYINLPTGSVGNAIRFGPAQEMYVADYIGHNIFTVAAEDHSIKILFHDDRMNQPNDLAVGPDGTLYASDPNWSQGSGQLWRIGLDGGATRLATDMGTTNGIEVSPDGQTLYVGESEQRTIWAFKINDNGSLSEKHIFMQFEEHGLDGMRSDVDGNLYITRYGAGTVLKVSPHGAVLREINVLGSRPSNLCLGGLDGRTAYVTEVEHRRLVRFLVDRPGLAWTRLKAN
ncbi:MAG TPA: SMP-30/gluconolactonase/LRE family protein [Acidobacteria bacterium]|nr:SMP-30/gluconolactonase/LRE family protein [Acidobacteriota bacterium]